ncbi:hypothetical protein KM043_012235 [Ampulex compressa]|nr:hypothetical protein KM043_012235 [Ampulex compressa]
MSQEETRETTDEFLPFLVPPLPLRARRSKARLRGYILETSCIHKTKIAPVYRNTVSSEQSLLINALVSVLPVSFEASVPAASGLKRVAGGWDGRDGAKAGRAGRWRREGEEEGLDGGGRERRREEESRGGPRGRCFSTFHFVATQARPSSPLRAP